MHLKVRITHSFICMSFLTSRFGVALGDEELRYKPCGTTVQQNSSNPHNEVKIARLHQQIHLYITFAFDNTLRFRVEFGLGDVSNTLQHYILETLIGYLNYELSQFVPEST